MAKSILQKMGFTKSEDDLSNVEPRKTFTTQSKSNQFPDKEYDISYNKETNTSKLFDNKLSEKNGEEAMNRKALEIQDSNPYLSQLEDVYQKEFVKLNKPDIDFFELFSMLDKAGNLDSLEGLKMAYGMCTSMNPNLTFKMLDEQCNQYAKSLMDGFNSIKRDAENKSDELRNQRSQAETGLTSKIQDLEEQLRKAKEDLASVSSIYDPKANEIRLKAGANQIAYSNLMYKINKVQSNIKKNL